MGDLTPSQAASQLGCSRTLIYRLIERGELPGTYQLPGSNRKRVPKDDIDALKRRNRVQPRQQVPSYEPPHAPTARRRSGSFAEELDVIERAVVA
jgi:excisionase family DNA binding protein